MTQPIGESMHEVIQRFDKVVSILLNVPSVKKLIDVDKLDTEDQGAKSKRFVLLRHEDISGISGTGIVAEGVLFPRGNAVLEWQTDMSGIEFFDDIDKVLKVHGHDGATEVIWIDE